MTFFLQIATLIATHRSRARTRRVTTADANPRLARRFAPFPHPGTAGIDTDTGGTAPDPGLRGLRFRVPRTVARVTLGVALLTGLVPVAAADVLVGNVEQEHTSGVALNSSVSARAQAFRTGAGPTLLTGVDVAFHSGPSATEDVTVTIRADRFGNPGATVATLTNPDDVSSEGAKSFTAPGGTVLVPRTLYWVHVERNSGTSFQLSATGSNSMDHGRLAGWSIYGTSKFRNGSGHWVITGGSVAMRISVNGSAAPALRTATVTDGDLVLTYDAELDPATAPNLDRFAVTVNGAKQTLRWVTFHGATIMLKLEVPAVSSETVRVSYDPPPRNGLQDVHGRKVLSFTGREVDNESAVCPNDQPADVFWQACLTLGRGLIRLGYDHDPRAEVHYPRAGALTDSTVTVDGTAHRITRLLIGAVPLFQGVAMIGFAADPGPDADDWILRIDGTDLDFADARVVYPDTWLRWDSGAPEWPHDSKLNERVSVSLRKAVRDDRAPQLVGLVAVDRDTLKLTYDEVLDAHSTPAPSDFTVQSVDHGRVTRTVSVTEVRVAGSTVQLTLAEATPAGDDWSVTYARGSSPIQDAAGNRAANFSMGYTPVDDRAPQLVGLVAVDGNTIELTYDAVLDAHSTPAPSDFTVQIQIGGPPVMTTSVTEVRVAGSKVRLKLAETIRIDDVWSVSYTKGSSPIQDLAGIQAVNFSMGYTPGNTPDPAPKLKSLVATADTLVVTYDRVLDAHSTPAAGDFKAQAWNGESTWTLPVTEVRVVGATVRLTLREALRPNGRLILSYTKGTNPIQDPAGNHAANFRYAVTNHTRIISVQDAKAREGTDDNLKFPVTLDQAAKATVTVDYATADGTAKAKSDYKAVRGTLTFKHGETAQTVLVKVRDDSRDEGTETLALHLSNATGAIIDDGKAVGFIINSDPMPQAWLAHFGRTAAEHVLEAVEQRLSGTVAPTAVLAGHVLGAADTPVSASELSASEMLARNGPSPRQTGAWQEQPSSMTFSELVAGSSVHVPAGGDGRWAVWGRGGWSRFDTSAGDLGLAGEVITATAGADYEHGRTLAGLALAYSTGRGVYEHAAAKHDDEVHSTLLSVHPYLRLTLHEQLAVWGLLGYGIVGDLKLDSTRATEAIETDAGLLMGAFGVRGTLVPAAPAGGFELTAKGDALLLSMNSDAVDGLPAAYAEVARSRLLLNAAYRNAPLLGGVLSPALELGGRYDGGDAERGAGLVVGASLNYGLPAWGLTLNATGRGVLTHASEGFAQWGGGGALILDPGAPGRGLALRVAPYWGHASASAEDLWSASASHLQTPAAAQAAPGARLAAELSYGLEMPRDGALVTPYAGMELADRGAASARVGGRLSVDPGLTVTLEGLRNDAAEPHVGPDYSLLLRGTVHY